MHRYWSTPPHLAYISLSQFAHPPPPVRCTCMYICSRSSDGVGSWYYIANLP